MSEPEENRRSLFRLQFPLGDQPLLITDLEENRVIELAEKSARLETTNTRLSSETWTPGVLKLITGTEIQTTVKLSRIEDDQIIVLLGSNITQKVIITEQRRLLAKYGKPRPQDS